MWSTQNFKGWSRQGQTSVMRSSSERLGVPSSCSITRQSCRHKFMMLSSMRETDPMSRNDWDIKAAKYLRHNVKVWKEANLQNMLIRSLESARKPWEERTVLSWSYLGKLVQVSYSWWNRASSVKSFDASTLSCRRFHCDSITSTCQEKTWIPYWNLISCLSLKV